MQTLDNGMVVSHSYDAAGRETVLQYLKSDGTPITLYTATHDAVGNILTVDELDGVGLAFGYDAADQLIHEERTGADAYDVTFSYDEAGNRATKQESAGLTTYTYDQANEILVETPGSGDPTTHTWDGNGNLWVENTGGQLTTYTWNDDNLLVGVASPDGTLHTHSYAPDGLRWKKETPEGTILFVRDGQNVFVETDESLVVQAQYTLAPEEWGELISQRRGADSSFYGFDLQTTTRVLVSVGGVVTDSESFRAFGERVAASGSTEYPFRYGGEVDYYSDTLGRVQVGLGDLDVDSGRWLKPDPGGPDALGNLYRYVRNNVPNRVDPSGLATIERSCEENMFSGGINTRKFHELKRALDTMCKTVNTLTGSTAMTGRDLMALQKCFSKKFDPVRDHLGRPDAVPNLAWVFGDYEELSEVLRKMREWCRSREPLVKCGGFPCRKPTVWAYPSSPGRGQECSIHLCERVFLERKRWEERGVREILWHELLHCSLPASMAPDVTVSLQAMYQGIAKCLADWDKAPQAGLAQAVANIGVKLTWGLPAATGAALYVVQQGVGSTLSGAYRMLRRPKVREEVRHELQQQPQQQLQQELQRQLEQAQQAQRALPPRFPQAQPTWAR